METYGSDKPDTRYGLLIRDITHHAKTRRLDLLYANEPEADVFTTADRIQVMRDDDGGGWREMCHA